MDEQFNGGLIHEDEFDIGAEMAMLYRVASQLETGNRTGRPRVAAAAAAVAVIGASGHAMATTAQSPRQALLAQGGLQVVVIPGDTLYAIASERLGSGTRWTDIARLNHIVDPARLQPGQVLELPALTKGLSRSRQEAGRNGSIQRGRHHRHRALAARPRVELVPAGRVVVELPARPRQSAPKASLLNATAGAAGRHYPSDLIDGLAFLIGALGTLMLLGRGLKDRPVCWGYATMPAARQLA